MNRCLKRKITNRQTSGESASLIKAGTESAEVPTSEKSRDLNRNSSRNKNETMFGSGYENCPELGDLGGVIFKLDIL
jgi:hypothetical protein